MKILVINTGSSSVKFSVYDMDTNEQIFKNEIQRVRNIEDALEKIPIELKKSGKEKIDAVGYRIAHGGEKFRMPVVIDDKVITAINECVPLAPLHNPPALTGIKMAMKNWPEIPHIAVFDTAFHQSIPEYAYTYAVPEKWREKGLRRYGFHGTSHKYVMERVAEELKMPATALRIISCHLGNGASVCAIDRGISVDNSMGMTALEGLVMGSRSGDVDPGIFSYLEKNMGLTTPEIEHSLYNESGLKGLSGIYNDMRDVEKKAAEGDKKSQLAINVYAYRAAKYIGAYAAVMRGFDVLAFTGGIGENSASMRKRICERLGFLGLYLDEDKNSTLKLVGFEAPQIQQQNSIIKIIVTQTREQWMIAKETYRLLSERAVKKIELPKIPVAVSAHHIHLNQESVEKLFGKGYKLKKMRGLTQPAGWAAEETVDVIGPKGTLKNLRVLGPCREVNQIEIAETEGFILGIDPPIRLSGDTVNTPVVTLVGPKGSIQTDGIIVAQRHIHMSHDDAKRFNLKHGDLVEVEVNSTVRAITFKNVVIRVGQGFKLEMHIDTDEANAAHISYGGEGELIPTTCVTAITHHQLTTAHECEDICNDNIKTANN